MNKTFYARFALPILMLVFFAAPFGVRGARLAFSTMKNDIKDWLPDSFEETKDLEWFRDNFLGEQFILLTWPGCRADDTRYKLMVEKLRHETALPSHVVKAAPAKDAEPAAAPDLSDPEAAAAAKALEEQAATERERQRNRDLGDRLGLTTTGDYSENWGGRDEKWLVGDKDQWYFLTPSGELFKWDGGSNLLGWASRRLTRLFTGKNTATGTLEAQVGAASAGDHPNEYYNDPRKITARLFKTVTTGPEVLERIAGEASGPWPGKDYSPEEKRAIALDRLRGALFGPDGEQTCMIVTLSDVGRRDLKRVLGRPLMGKPAGRLLQMADEAGLSPDDLRMGGPPVDNVAIDEEGSITLVRLIGWSLLVGVGLAYLSFRSVKITMMVFFVGGMSAILSLSFLWYGNDTVDAIVMSMPSLVYVLGLTGAIHMLTYYRHHVREHGLLGAPEATIQHTWRPLLLGQITSALGLLSLLTSELLPIRKFGWYSALGTLATLIVMYLFLPSALQLWPPKTPRRHAGEPADEDWLQKLTAGFWRGFSGAVVRNHYWIAPAMLVFVCVMFYGTTMLKTNVHLLKMFDADAKIIRDYAWLEQNLGRLVPMELVVRVAPEVSAPLTRPASNTDDGAPVKELSAAQQLVQYNFLERMELAAHVQRAVELEFGPDGQNILGQGMSAVTFAPPLPAPGGYSFRSIRGVFNRKLEQHRDEILHSDYLRVDKDPAHAGAELWRVSLRLGALNNVDYGEFVSDLQSVVEPALAACRHREALLTRLATTRGDDGLVGARVAVIGLSNPAKYAPVSPAKAKVDVAERTKIRPVAATAADLAAVQRDEQRSYERQQDRVFSQTLHDLLVNRGFKTAANAKTRLDFLDAETLAPAGRPLSAAEIGKKLASYDCVVFAQPVAACDLAMVTSHAKQLVDASDFRFDPAAKLPTAARRDDHVQAIYTGVVPIVYKAQRSLLDSLVSSTNWAFSSIALCMMLLLRSGRFRLTNLLNCRGGLVAMLPNIFPLIVVFGALGYLGVEIDIGSMMTASIAIGVAVDDTIHYLEWFRAGMKRGLSRREAIIGGYEHFGPAIIETMLIGGLGLSVFALSTFTPTQRFGLMMLSMLTVGVVGEVIWFPALLAGPLGKYLEPKMDRVTPAAESVVAPAIVPAATHPHIEPPHTGRNVVRRDRAH